MRELGQTKSDQREKEELRGRLLREREKVKDTKRKDEIIQEKILGSDYFRQAKSVLAYVAKEEETATFQILKNAIRNKQTFVPVTVQHPQPEESELQISEVNSLDELREGSFRVPEPRKPDFENHLSSKVTPDLLVVPGVAFSENKNRLGYGAGYFDQYLSQIPAESVIVGLAYERQIVENLPVEEHDVPVDLVVTEDRIIGW